MATTVWVAYGASYDIDGLAPWLIGVCRTETAAYALLRHEYIREETGYDPDDPGAAAEDEDTLDAIQRAGERFDAGLSLPIHCGGGDVALSLRAEEVQ